MARYIQRVEREKFITYNTFPIQVIIQSPIGGEITPEAILAKVGEADTVYVRVDENKAYWVRGEEHGSVELW